MTNLGLMQFEMLNNASPEPKPLSWWRRTLIAVLGWIARMCLRLQLRIDNSTHLNRLYGDSWSGWDAEWSPRIIRTGPVPNFYTDGRKD